MNEKCETTFFYRVAVLLLLLLSVTSSGVMAAVFPTVAPLPAITDGTGTPVRMAEDQLGNIYVTDPRGGGILKFGRNGLLQQRIGNVNNVIGMAVAQNGNLLVSQGSSVAVLDKASGAVLSRFGNFGVANSIAVDGSGKIFVTDSRNNCVQVFTAAYAPVPIATAAAGMPNNSFGSRGRGSGQFLQPSGITYEKISNLMAVVDTLNGKIQFYSTGGVYQYSIGSFGAGPLLFTSPQSIAFEYNASNTMLNRIYVLDTFQSNIQVLDATGTEFLGYIGGYGLDSGELVLPSDLLFDRFDTLNYRLVVANGNGALALFSVEGIAPLAATIQPPTAAGQLTIQWLNPVSPDFHHIRIYRSTIAGQLGSMIADFLSGTSYTDTGLTALTRYYYTLRAVSTTGSETANSEQISETTIGYYTLTTSLAGTGSGTISSDANFACTSGSCNNSLLANTRVTLFSNPDSSSLFTGWSGECTNTSGSCIVTMTAAKNVTATFERQKPFKVNATFYDSLQTAYNWAPDGAVIQLMAGTVLANPVALTADIAKNVTIIGGYDAGYTVSSDLTIIQGRVNLKAGKVLMERVKLQ